MHTVDGYTIALWRYDETSNPTHDYDIAVATVNSPTYDLTQSNAADRPLISGGQEDGYYARVFRQGSGSGESLTMTPDAAFLSVFENTHRVKYWLYLEDDVASTGDIWGVGGNRVSDSAGTNNLHAHYLVSPRRLFIFTEFGGGTNNTIDTGYDIPLRTWVEIDVTFTIGATTAIDLIVTELGGSPNLEFTDSGYSNATGGATGALFGLGAGTSGSTALFGRIADFRIWNTDDDSGEPWERYELTEEPGALDISGNGYHLSHSNLTSIDDCFVTSTIISGDGRSRECTSSCALLLPKRQELINLLRDETWTLECWIYRNSVNPVSYEAIFEYAGDNSDSGGDTNIVASVATTNGGLIRINHETGSGVDQTDLSSTKVVIATTTTEREERHHLAIVKVPDGVGTSTWKLYVDGAFAENIVTTKGDAEGGNDPSGLLYIGRGSGGFPFFGRIDDMRLSSIERTADEIYDGYLAGLGLGVDDGGGGGGTATEYYLMVAIDGGNPSQPAYHSWIVTDAPDSTGSQAVGGDAPPFGGPLSNIHVSAVWRE